MRPARFVLAASLALALAGCGADATADAPVARDSVGIRIVENPAPDGRTALVLEAEPVVSIGSLEGPVEYTFQSVRDAARLEDGRMVVADGAELRFYDADGTHLRTAGGAGEGPGDRAEEGAEDQRVLRPLTPSRRRRGGSLSRITSRQATT